LGHPKLDASSNEKSVRTDQIETVPEVENLMAVAEIGAGVVQTIVVESQRAENPMSLEIDVGVVRPPFGADFGNNTSISRGG